MDNRYKQILLNDAMKLDAIASYDGKVAKCALDIVERGSSDSTVEMCKILSSITSVDDKQTRQFALSVKDSLVRYYGAIRVSEIYNGAQCADHEEDKRTFEDLMEELNGLVGLAQVKSKVNDLVAFQKVQKLRRENGLHTLKNTLHLAFTGNPGTGKTTVARIVGRLYKQIGLLSKGHFIEVSRTDLIAGYQGQTALKVKSVIEKAKGGVLFIDEAYSITENERTDSYGRECLTELTKALEDYRDDLVVIVAGYTAPMKVFFESNPGLKSRFNTFIEFDDYSADELNSILVKMCQSGEYDLSADAADAVSEKFKDVIANKTEQFANGRYARNLYENLVMNHASRVALIGSPTIKDLRLITKCDVDQSVDIQLN